MTEKENLYNSNKQTSYFIISYVKQAYSIGFTYTRHLFKVREILVVELRPTYAHCVPLFVGKPIEPLQIHLLVFNVAHECLKCHLQLKMQTTMKYAL